MSSSVPLEIPRICSILHESMRSVITNNRRARANACMDSVSASTKSLVESERVNVRNIIADFKSSMGIATPFVLACNGHSFDSSAFEYHCRRFVAISIALDAELPPDIMLTVNISRETKTVVFCLSWAIFTECDLLVKLPEYNKETDMKHTDHDGKSLLNEMIDILVGKSFVENMTKAVC